MANAQMEFVDNSARAIVGLRPSFSSQVRWCEPGAPVHLYRRSWLVQSYADLLWVMCGDDAG